MNDQPRRWEREKKRERSTAHRPCGVLRPPPGDKTGQIYRWNKQTNKNSTKSTKWNWNAINKRCIYMQTLKDNYAQKESEKQTCIIAWHSIMAKSCVSLFFFCLLNYSRKVTLNHRQLRLAGWVLLKCENGDTDTQLRHDAVQIFTV